MDRQPAPRPPRPAIVAHRGASGYLPEHTLAAYELGIRLGADAFEIDVVPTRDGHLVARHENELSGSTDVADHPRFAARRTTKLVEGTPHTGWFAEDFTLAELGELRAREPLPALRSTAHDDLYAVPDLPTILALRARLAAELDRAVGLKLEVKTPAHFAAIGVPVLDRLVADLDAAGMIAADSPVEIMTFELHHLRALRARGIDNPLVFLVESDPSSVVVGEGGATVADLIAPAGLERVRAVAEALGP
ncbi:MAG: glycerophosphodiester phosphodiesterase family protein, partial [Nostocoides sp.]